MEQAEERLPALTESFNDLTQYGPSKVGLSIPAGLSFDDWRKLGARISTIRGWSEFCVGDWMLYGDGAYGEKSSQAMEETGFTLKTINHAIWLCKKVPRERRRKN